MARLNPGPRFDHLANPYESSAKRQEREEDAARSRKMKWYVGGGLALVAILAVLYFTVFTGTRAGESPLSPNEHDVANMKYLDQRLADVNKILTDPATAASEKAVFQKEKKELERSRDELLKKRPDLKR